MRLGDWVQVSTQRPHKEQYNGAVGQIASITNRDIVYVCIGARTPCFYMDEVKAITLPPATEGRAA